jgi:hypothetical protein
MRKMLIVAYAEVRPVRKAVTESSVKRRNRRFALSLHHPFARGASQRPGQELRRSLFC